MKVEPRGKFGGVKIHLDAEEAQALLDATSKPLVAAGSPAIGVTVSFAAKMGKKIRELLSEDPGLLTDRTPEQVIAVLAKEAEKSALQLERAKKGADISKIDPKVLEKALLKHVPKG